MKVFISWSGDLSKEVAILLRGWLPKVMPSLDLWVSTEDIASGRVWSEELNRQLRSTDAGVLCLTSENVARPWINFEAGFLSHQFERAHVCPFLVDLEPRQLKGPLSQFQCVTGRQGDLLSLLNSLSQDSRNRLDQRELSQRFQEHWPIFDAAYQKILGSFREEAGELAVLEQQLQQISSDYLSALGHDHQVFREVVKNEVFRLATTSGTRARRILDASVENYHQLLLDLYRTARESVFSTSLPEYDTTWNSSLGESILQAHQAADAKVTRIFVFETADQVNDRHVEIMQKQIRCPKITVRVYINTEDPTFEFSTDYSRDFTIIDNGRAIGLTQSYGLNNLRAIWHFGDRALAGRLQAARIALSRNSLEFSTFMDRHCPSR